MVVVTRQATRCYRDMRGLRMLIGQQRKTLATLPKQVEAALGHLDRSDSLLSWNIGFFPGYYYSFKEQVRNALEALDKAQKAMEQVAWVKIDMKVKQKRLGKIVTVTTRKKKRKNKPQWLLYY